MPTKTGAKLDTLQALNIMASYLGIPPLIALVDIATEPDFVLAQSVLDDVTQTTLSQGLPCNTDYQYPLTEVQVGTLYTIIPDGALICQIDDTSRYTERDGLVYNLRTREFETSVALKAYIVWLQTFDELPEVVKRYILTAASRALVHRIKGDAGISQLTIPDERRTKIEFQRYVQTMDDLSMLSDASLEFITRRRQYYRRY